MCYRDVLQSVTVCCSCKAHMLSIVWLFPISAGLSVMSAVVLLHVAGRCNMLQCISGPFPMSVGLFLVWVQKIF